MPFLETEWPTCSHCQLVKYSSRGLKLRLSTSVFPTHRLYLGGQPNIFYLRFFFICPRQGGHLQLITGQSALTLLFPSTDIHTCSAGKHRERCCLLFHPFCKRNYCGILLRLCYPSLCTWLSFLTKWVSTGYVINDKLLTHTAHLLLWKRNQGREIGNARCAFWVTIKQIKSSKQTYIQYRETETEIWGEPVRLHWDGQLKHAKYSKRLVLLKYYRWWKDCLRT